MTDKVLCPWCGRKTKIYFEENGLEDYMAWSLCTYGKCAAEGPFIRGAKTEEEAIRLATEAALRRYEPTVRPLTLEELNDSTDDPVYIEFPKREDLIGKFTAAVICHRIIWSDGTESNLDRYGKTWRCWPRKPTEEERREAKWDDD